MLLERMQASEEAEYQSIKTDFLEIIEKWRLRAENRQLEFVAGRDRSIPSLIKAFGEEGDARAWPTLHSMRNVDAECKIRVQS